MVVVLAAYSLGHKMDSVSESRAAVGAPVFLHTIGDESSPSARVARWRHSGGKFDISASDAVRITVNLQDGVAVRHQMGDLPVRAFVASVGSVSVTPAHQPAQLSIVGQADVLQLIIREAFLEAAVDRPFTCSSLINSHDSELQAAAMQLFVAAARGDTDDSLLLASSMHRIADRLLDTSRQGAPSPTHGGLAHAAHRRVENMISAALNDANVRSPTLDELADAARLSVNHFIRAFHQQTGVTPHRHVVLRRLERGIELLKRPGMSVAEVADDTGFATPAHFVATFRRKMGVTPGAFRTALQG